MNPYLKIAPSHKLATHHLKGSRDGQERQTHTGDREKSSVQSVPFIQYLKGPKREIFVTGIFTEIRPVWVGDLETRPKI
jgi:hypothetical protein